PTTTTALTAHQLSLHDALPISAPLGLGVVAHVGGIADPLGLLGLLSHVDVVDDDHALRGHARELASRLGDVCEVVCGDPRSLPRSEEHTSELQSRSDLVCRLLL